MTNTDMKLLLTIVDRDHGEGIVAITKKAGAQGGTILLGRGTAQRWLMQVLGLGDPRKDIVITLLSSSTLNAVEKELRTDPWVNSKVRGVSTVLDVSLLLRCASSSVFQPKGASMSASTHELISVIVNAGFADDVMAAARKAGATGGTIINARGTGREEDVKFFGITIVPEKELLLILTARETAPAILEAIRTQPYLTEPGMGIAFCMPVEQFMPIGKTTQPKA